MNDECVKKQLASNSGRG